MDKIAEIVDDCRLYDEGRSAQVEWNESQSFIYFRLDGSIRVCSQYADDEFLLTTGAAEMLIGVLRGFIVANSKSNQQINRVTNEHISGFTGVSWDKRAKKWRARTTIDKKQVDVGVGYSTVLCAASSILSYWSERKGEAPPRLLEQYAELLKLEGGAE